MHHQKFWYATRQSVTIKRRSRFGRWQELGLFKIAEGKTIDDLKAFLLTPPGTPPPAGPPPFTSAGGTVGLSSKAHSWLTLDLSPGTYAMVCFFPDPTKNGLPHALEGMIKEVTVS